MNVLHRAGKRGLGTAYLEGFAWALARDYDYVFEMDADYSHRPGRPGPPARRDQHGRRRRLSRLALGSGRRIAQLVVRAHVHLSGWLAVRAPDPGHRVSDLTSGFKCFSRRVLERLDLSSVGSNGYAFEVEMNYRCHRQGFSIAEVPITVVNGAWAKAEWARTS